MQLNDYSSDAERQRLLPFVTRLACADAAAGWPLVARAQQLRRTIGWLSPRSPEADTEINILAAFRQGLKETGYVEGQNFAIEFRHGEGVPPGGPKPNGLSCAMQEPATLRPRFYPTLSDGSHPNFHS